MQRFDTIGTGRLILRRWQEGDRAPFAELNGDPATLVFFPSTLSREESDEFVDRIEARFERDGYGLWALEVRRTGEFIGFAGLAPLREDVPNGGGMEIGWRLARHAWHQGYATEAARAARDVAFDGAGLPELSLSPLSLFPAGNSDHRNLCGSAATPRRDPTLHNLRP